MSRVAWSGLLVVHVIVVSPPQMQVLQISNQLLVAVSLSCFSMPTEAIPVPCTALHQTGLRLLLRILYDNRRHFQRCSSMSVHRTTLVSTAVHQAEPTFSLQVLHINIQPLLAVGGVSGLAIGFGAQSVLANAISGISLVRAAEP